MEIRRFLDTLQRRALLIFVVAAMTMVVVTVAGILIPPVYTAEAKVSVLWDVGVSELSPREYVADRLVTTYKEVLTSDPALSEAIRRVSPDSPSLTVEELARVVEVTAVPDSDLLSISVQNGDPALARDLANALATLLIEYAQAFFIGIDDSAEQLLDEQATSYEDEIQRDYQLLATAEAQEEDSPEAQRLKRQISQKEETYRRLIDRAELVAGYELLRANSVRIIAPAALPQVPSNQLGRQEIGLALVVGLCGGIGLALLLDSLDTRIRSPEQAERLAHLPVLGTVPANLPPASASGKGRETDSRARSEEAYRLLAANLRALARESSVRTVLSTRIVDRAKEAEIVVHLAPIMAQSGQRILVVDTNFQNPTLHQHFGLSNQLGLSSILSKQASIQEAIQDSTYSGVYVLTSGAVPPNPSQVIGSPEMATLIGELGEQFDSVYLNATPALEAPDAISLAQTVDGVILLLDQSLSTEDEANQALHRLQAARAPLLGLVLVQKKDYRRPR